MRPCPFCDEPIQDQAIKCRWCKEMLAESPQRKTKADLFSQHMAPSPKAQEPPPPGQAWPDLHEMLVNSRKEPPASPGDRAAQSSTAPEEWTTRIFKQAGNSSLFLGAIAVLAVVMLLSKGCSGGSAAVRSAAYEKGYGEGEYCEQWGGSQSLCVDDCRGDAYRLYRSDSDISAYERGCSAGWRASYGG